MRLLLLSLLFYIPAIQAQQGDMLERLLLYSGVELVVSSYPQQLAAQFGLFPSRPQAVLDEFIEQGR